MGGVGSGRQYFSGSTSKLDEGKNLSIKRFREKGVIQDNYCARGIWQWSNVHTGVVNAKIGYEINTTDINEMYIKFDYSVNDVPVSYKVELEVTKPNYGGHRYWFICPVTGARSSVLYMPNGSKKFLSRKAYRLSYSSQSEGLMDRLIRKKNKLKDKVENKKLHRKTRYKLWGDIDMLEMKFDCIFFRRFRFRV